MAALPKDRPGQHMGLSYLIYIFEEAEIQISRKIFIKIQKKEHHKNKTLHENNAYVLHAVVKPGQ